MKKVQTVAVVGAGITGITAAYFEAIRGNYVYLIEMDKHPGGLLKSEVNNFGAFDYGTHVGTELGVKELDEFLFGGMTSKDFDFFNPGDSGNYFAGQLSSVSPFVNTTYLDETSRHQSGLELLKTKTEGSFTNLQELMIARYGATIYEKIFKAIVHKFMGCSATDLAPEVIYFFDMNRLVAFDKEISDRLKTIACYDEILGFHYPSPGRQKIYPKSGGISHWIQFLIKKLKGAGVRFLTETRVQSIKKEGSRVTHLNTGTEKIKIDKLTWSVPAALFSRLAEPTIVLNRPKFRKTGLYNFSFAEPLNTACYYINVYDTSLLSGRMTLYQNLTKADQYFNCTIEVLQEDDFDFSSAIDRVLEEVYAMGLAARDNRCVYKGMIQVNNGFPILDVCYLKKNKTLLDQLQSLYSNVDFLGRGNGGFFMRDVLKHAYQSVVKETSAEPARKNLKKIP